ncbi:MAG TPA: glycosyltransferase [Bryobacteraceae bacterium]|nr:glycosyltransferase [Bryobacteraceae bacterium]
MPRLPDALSFCIIAKNEAHHLRKCLDSVRGLAGEIVLVDTGSTDETKDIARDYGALVFPFDFTRVDFSGARNLALSHARAPWILMLDADETLAAGGAAKIEARIALGENIGFFLERHNNSDPPVTDYVVRLFPNRPDYRYRGRVHELIDNSILAVGGRLVKTDIRIDHNFSSDPEARRRKNHWYIEILKEEIVADPSDDSRLDFLAAEYHQLGMFDHAIEVTRQIIQARPRDAQAHYFLGVYQFVYKSDLKSARAFFNRALELRPDYPEAAAFLQKIAEREASVSK